MRCIVDQDVDAAQLGCCVVHDLATVCAVLDVARDQHALAAGAFDPTRRLLAVVMFAEVSNQQIGALTGEGYGDSATDAAVAARDDGPLPGQPARAAVRVHDRAPASYRPEYEVKSDDNTDEGKRLCAAQLQSRAQTRH